MSLKNFTKKSKPVTCSQNFSVKEVADLMKANNIGTVLVVEREKPIGLITDRDIVTRCITDSTDCNRITAKDIMSTPVYTIDDQSSILDLVEEMSAHHVRRVAIVNREGRVTGMLSMADVFELLSHEMSLLAEALGTRHQKLFKRANGNFHATALTF